MTMNEIDERLAANRYLSVAIILLLIASAAGGLLVNDLYRDSNFIKAAWYANDWISLVVAVPLLIASTILYLKRSARGMMVWLGSMLYVFYNFAFYLFGAAFNWFFLIYVSLFALSLYALILGLLHFNSDRTLQPSISSKSVRIMVAIFLLFIAFSLGIVEVVQCFNFIINGTLPEVPTLIFALDLSLVVPACILAAVLLLKKNTWGAVLAMMMLVKSFIYGMVLVTGTILVVFRKTAGWDPLMPFYAFVALGGLILGIMLLRNLKHENLD